MSTVQVSLAEYLDTAYSPDREYVDGVVVERNLGERPHSRTQSNFVFFFGLNYPHLFAWPEQRVRTVRDRRSRVPDLCVTLQDPGIDVFEEPPFLVVEILSKRDQMGDVLEKLDEYEAFGVAHIWLIDPRRRKAFTYGRGGLELVTGITLAAGEIQMPLEEVFRGL
jgi:Uma2 family endonuclease